MKIKVAILGATGMVGQRFITLLDNHPWFQTSILAASAKSAGKKYKDAVKNRWRIDCKIPHMIKNIKVLSVEDDIDVISKKVKLVFCALDLDKEKIKKIEMKYAAKGVAVISNNSAHRWTEDIPMIIPEINPHHIEIINSQRKNRRWDKGFIAVKPNCSIQSYVTILTALKDYLPLKVHIVSLQAISGSGKNFSMWPQMLDNVIPFISGEEEKSEKEPLKIWGKINDGKIILAKNPIISASCIRVPVSDGHMANVSVKFKNKPTKREIINKVQRFNPLIKLKLPSSPEKLIKYFEDEDRPQTNSDRKYENGMGITMGRLREDGLFDWKFVALSHNTIRGAAGGAILLAELLLRKGYISSQYGN